MSLFALASIALSILSTGLATFIFLQARNRAHYIWAIFNLSIAIWGLALFLVGIAKTEQEAIFYWRWAFAFNTFIPIFFYHLVFSLCKLKKKWILISLYIEGSLFLPLILFTKNFVGEVEFLYDSIYFFKPNPWYYVWLILLAGITILSFVRLFDSLRKFEGDEKKDSLYLFWGVLSGFLGGFTLALPTVGIHIYPAWHFTICIYTAIITFAFLRHGAFDIRVTLTRLLIPIAFLVILIFAFCFTHFEMNLFTIASLSLGIACFLLAYIIACYAKQKMHWIWALFNISLGIWGAGTFFVGISDSPDLALIAWKIAYAGVLFVPVFFYHMVHLFCGLRGRKFLNFTYIQGILVVAVDILTNFFVGRLEYLFNSFYYHRVTKVYLFFFLIWSSIVSISFWELYKFIKIADGIKKIQALYLFWGMLLGFLGGTTVVAPAFGIEVYPYGHFFICIYAAICTYAIFRYHLMDIRIAVTRLGVFVIVYSLVLGVPFGLAIMGKSWLIGLLGEQWFWVPMLSLLTLATAGPFIYLFIQRKAEAVLLQEEKRIQDLLSRVSVGMRTIRDLSKLLELIIDILIKHLKLDNAAIYLYNTETSKYVAKVSEPERVNNTKMDKDVSLVRRLEETKYPVVYEEVKLLSDSEQNGNKVLREIAGQMAGLQASVVVPAMSDNFLLGFIVLGERKDKRLYSVDLINVLSVLGNQAALAIENCHYIQRMQAEGLAERMISLDHMASSMAHEIDNPMHIIRTSLSFVKSALLRDPRVSMPAEIKQDFDESLARSLNASERVSSMIKAILDYSRMGTGKLESIRVSDALEGFLQLIQPQIREEKVQFAKEIENDLPPVLGDRVQMEEVFMNFVRNSLHAVRRNEEKKISLKIFRKNETIIRIECSDNGYGIPGEIINDIFLSSMTTKGSSEGTGLGLYRVRKIVDLFRGKVWAESEGKGKGATFIVELPVYGGHKSNTNGD